jgi:hypothetical protein
MHRNSSGTSSMTRKIGRRREKRKIRRKNSCRVSEFK